MGSTGEVGSSPHPLHRLADVPGFGYQDRERVAHLSIAEGGELLHAGDGGLDWLLERLPIAAIGTDGLSEPSDVLLLVGRCLAELDERVDTETDARCRNSKTELQHLAGLAQRVHLVADLAQCGRGSILGDKDDRQLYSGPGGHLVLPRPGAGLFEAQTHRVTFALGTQHLVPLHHQVGWLVEVSASVRQTSELATELHQTVGRVDAAASGDDGVADPLEVAFGRPSASFHLLITSSTTSRLTSPQPSTVCRSIG